MAGGFMYLTENVSYGEAKKKVLLEYRQTQSSLLIAAIRGCWPQRGDRGWETQGGREGKGNGGRGREGEGGSVREGV